MENSIKYSIIVPVYNSGIYLRTAIDSILMQSFKEFELILVDDGSIDGSSELCDEYAKLDHRIIVIHQKNSGICNARNNAMKIARGEYLAFSDHDDEYLPGLLEDNYELAKKYNLDFVKFCSRQDIIKDGKLVSSVTNYAEAGIYEREDLKLMIYDLYFNNFCTCVWDGIYKRSFLEKHEIMYDEYFKKGFEDLDFFAKVLMYVQRYGIHNKCYYVHNLRLSFSTSLKPNPLIIDCQRTVPQNFLKILTSLNITPEDDKEKYTFFYYYIYMIHVVIQLNKRKKCTNKERVEYMKKMKLENVCLDFMTNVTLPFRKYKHYYFIHKWFFNNHYKLILYFYRAEEFVHSLLLSLHLLK